MVRLGPLVLAALFAIPAAIQGRAIADGRQAEIPLVASRYRLWSPATGEPVSLVSYSVPLTALEFFTDRGQQAARLALTWREHDVGTGDWFDTTLVRDYHPEIGGQNTHLQAVIIAPREHGATDWSFAVAQEHDRHGLVSENASPLGDGPLVLSDVVIGDSAQHFAWIVPGDSIVLAPLGTASPSVVLDLFFQLNSRVDRNDARTSIAVYPIAAGKRGAEPALQIAWIGNTQRGLTPIHRGLDISRLEVGVYDLEIRVSSGSDVAARSRRLVIR